jgi:hypothetical protein
LREGDAEPDEIAIIPDPQQASKAAEADDGSCPPSPGGHPIPKTVLSESPGHTGPHSELFEKKIEVTHKADAAPDAVVKAGDGNGDGSEKDSSGMDVEKPRCL